MFEAKKFFNIFDVTSYIKLFAFGLRIAVVLLFVMGIVWVKNFMFPPKVKSTINQPVFTVEEGGSVTYTNTQSTDKDWSVGVFGGSMYYDEELGYFGGLEIKKKF